MMVVVEVLVVRLAARQGLVVPAVRGGVVVALSLPTCPPGLARGPLECPLGAALVALAMASLRRAVTQQAACRAGEANSLQQEILSIAFK